MHAATLLAQASSQVSSEEDLNLLGDDLLAWLTLALGAALAVGTLLALVRPREAAGEGELERPPLLRSLVMIAVGSLAALWGVASLLAAGG
jgi:hypothetical protein